MNAWEVQEEEDKPKRLRVRKDYVEKIRAHETPRFSYGSNEGMLIEILSSDGIPNNILKDEDSYLLDFVRRWRFDDRELS